MAMRARTTTRGAQRLRARNRPRRRQAHGTESAPRSPSSSPPHPPISAIAVPSLPLHLLPCLRRAQPVTAPPLPFPLRCHEPDDRHPIPLPFFVPPSGHQDRVLPSVFSSSSPFLPREFDTTETSPTLRLSPSPLCSLSVTAADCRCHHRQCPPFPPSLFIPSTARLFLFIFSFVFVEHHRRPPLRQSHYPCLHHIDALSLLSPSSLFPSSPPSSPTTHHSSPSAISLSIVMITDDHCPPPPPPPTFLPSFLAHHRSRHRSPPPPLPLLTFGSSIVTPQTQWRAGGRNRPPHARHAKHSVTK